ncbi:hypothetical protein THAOC_00985 [Thalassiosira oceanica]|uniref:Uncharacterized protein n=1 Tax=Thalassiosira oceanica TaxID=159749 RepID=K0TNK5_THAOC|nr:hypothetical protein THAOC_00985 [Thalassiosira oceanica]|eukprot:EJK77201.1 hypothetical protein THAOC_00985 [Thalassiosira oceanica]
MVKELRDRISLRSTALLRKPTASRAHQCRVTPTREHTIVAAAPKENNNASTSAARRRGVAPSRVPRPRPTRLLPSYVGSGAEAPNAARYSSPPAGTATEELPKQPVLQL